MAIEIGMNEKMQALSNKMQFNQFQNEFMCESGN